jgi:hypothetical protein
VPTKEIIVAMINPNVARKIDDNSYPAIVVVVFSVLRKKKTRRGANSRTNFIIFNIVLLYNVTFNPSYG